MRNARRLGIQRACSFTSMTSDKICSELLPAASIMVPGGHMIDTDNKLDSLKTRGIARNRREEFTIKLTGQQVYDFLHMCEERAMEGRNYLAIRQAVAFAELIRDQVKEQGF